MKDIAFSDITGEFAESFKVFLKKELRHRNGHVNHCLCWFNRLIYIFVDREVMPLITDFFLFLYHQANYLQVKNLSKTSESNP